MRTAPLRQAVIAALSCQQYLSISLIYAAIPVVLRQAGAPLALIGLFGMVFFAFTINFLWAPLLDRYRLTSLGRRRSWLLVTQLAGGLTIAAMALLDPVAEQHRLFAVCVLLATIAATQRIATLGYVADVLPDAERSVGAALLGWGGALGNLLGGAGCLFLIERFGWRPALATCAAVLLLLALLILRIAEPPARDRPAAGRAAAWRSILQPRLWGALAIVAPATVGVAIAFAMVQPRLVDLGFSLTGIGATVAVIHLVAFSLIGPAAGLLARRIAPLRGIVIGGAFIVPGFLVLALIDGWLGPQGGAITAVVLVFSTLAAQSVAFTTFFFSLADDGRAATVVTFLQAMMSLLALVGFAASGFVAQSFGYAATLLAAAAGYAATMALVTLRR